MSCCVKSSNALVFPDSDGPIIKTMYGHFLSSSLLFLLLEQKDVLVQLEASKSSIKDMFEDLLNGMKGFKYQIIVAVLLSKHKENRNIEYSPVCSNSATKTLINSDNNLDKSFQEAIYRIDKWINEGSGWIVESINGEYVNTSI